jgi:hypothetical protein
MLDTFKTLIVHQYEAALSMLNACVDRCPETIWEARVVNYPFCQVVFHTLFWTDVYLGQSAESSCRQPFGEWLRPGGVLDVEVRTGYGDPVFQHDHLFGDYVRFADRAPVRLYDKAAIRAYLDHCRAKVSEVMGAETVDTLSTPSDLRPDLSRAEVHLYNIRHVQHHTSQLSLRLRLDANRAIDWPGSGWHEPALITDRPG